MMVNKLWCQNLVVVILKPPKKKNYMKINSKLQHLVKLTWKQKTGTTLGFTREQNLSLTCIICLLAMQQLTMEQKIMILISVINKKNSDM
jgi:hypothetical protein